MPLPQKLYKYYPFNTQTQRLLTHSQLYYASPKKFNDPLDCRPNIDVDVDVKEIENLYLSMFDTDRLKYTAIMNIIEMHSVAKFDELRDGSRSEDDIYKRGSF